MGNHKQPARAVQAESGAKQMSTCTVYGLYTTRNNRPRYIGQTTQSIRRRLHQHLADARNKARSDTYCHRWIRKELRNGHEIEICAIEEDCLLNVSEMNWIAFFKSIYPDTVNTQVGGTDGNLGRKFSEETKAKMRKPKSEETKLRMSKPKSEETRAKMSLAQRGNSKGRGSLNGHTTFTEDDVENVKALLAMGALGSDLARVYGVKKSAISKIKVGRSWCHVS